jgi:hypothetical protein
MAMYLSARGEFYCYMGICETDINRRELFSWPYFLHNKHIYTASKKLINMLGMYRLYNGCIKLSKFVDHELFQNMQWKQIKNYFVKLPTVNDCYFGIVRCNDGTAESFKENPELTRACFGLTYYELSALTEIYSEILGEYNAYQHYPKITRSARSNNWCDLTDMWIPKGFPYVAFAASGGAYSHISLHGFYQHIGALLVFPHSPVAEDLKSALPQELMQSLQDVSLRWSHEPIVYRSLFSE